MSFCVYQLRLIENKHYFGTTPSYRKKARMTEHRQGVAAKWTTRFPPVEDNPVNTWYFRDRESAYKFEDYKCCEFLEKYGIDSTRGGLQNADIDVPYRYWVRKELKHLIP